MRHTQCVIAYGKVQGGLPAVLSVRTESAQGGWMNSLLHDKTLNKSP